MVMGLEKAKEFLKTHNNMELYIIYDDKGELKTWSSKGFPLETQ
jgi:hypothetical protein